MATNKPYSLADPNRRHGAPVPQDERDAIVRDALERYAQGVSIQVVAKEAGLTRAIIYRWMLAHAGPEYEDIVTRALVRRIAEADERMEAAEGPVDIARAREQARFARMDYERRRPALYGQRSHVTVETVGDLGDRLRRAREREIQGEVVSEQHDAAQQLPELAVASAQPAEDCSNNEQDSLSYPQI